MTTPPPRSPQAISFGCKCPVLDNANGKGYMGVEGVYVYSVNCLIHWPEIIEAQNRPITDEERAEMERGG